MTTELSFKPIKRNLWTDFEELFGPNGACAGCWCMFWKLRGKEYEEAKGFETRQMHKSIVDSGVATGLLAYLHGDVVGWIAVEPREAYPRLAHSRTLKPVDDQPVWSVTCFFVAKKFRRKGITVELLLAANVALARVLPSGEWFFQRWSGARAFLFEALQSSGGVKGGRILPEGTLDLIN